MATTSKGSLVATVVLVFFMVVTLFLVPTLFEDFSFKAFESEQDYSQQISGNWSDYGTLNNLEIINTDLVLKDSYTSGSYDSETFESGKYILESVSYDTSGIIDESEQNIMLTVTKLDDSYNVIDSNTISLNNGSYQETCNFNTSGYYEFDLNFNDPDRITKAPLLSYLEFEGSVKPVNDITRLKYVIFIVVALVAIYVAATGAS